MMLLSGCASLASSEIDAVCSLLKDLPTVSGEDTDRTIIEVDNFNAKFKRVCK